MKSKKDLKFNNTNIDKQEAILKSGRNLIGAFSLAFTVCMIIGTFAVLCLRTLKNLRHAAKWSDYDECGIDS